MIPSFEMKTKSIALGESSTIVAKFCCCPKNEEIEIKKRIARVRVVFIYNILCHKSRLNRASLC